MTSEEIGAIAEKYRATRHGESSMAGKDPLSPNYAVFAESSYFALRYQNGRLSTIGEGHIDENGETVVDRVIYLCGDRTVREPLLKR